jgi:hypothetical protein
MNTLMYRRFATMLCSARAEEKELKAMAKAFREEYERRNSAMATKRSSAYAMCDKAAPNERDKLKILQSVIQADDKLTDPATALRRAGLDDNDDG